MELIVVFLLAYAVYGVIFGAFCAYLANEKGRDGVGWFLLGLVFGVVALIALVGASQKHAAPSAVYSGGRPSDNIRLCPYCIQEVHHLATVCPHCQRDLPQVERCSLEDCGKIINPTDSRCEDAAGNPYCGDLHLWTKTAGVCSYCGKVITPDDSRCENKAGNLYCSPTHRLSAAHLLGRRCSYLL